MLDELLGGGTSRLTPRELAMVRYADKLTAAPATMQEADVEALRNAGLADCEIHDLAQVVAYFAYVNRIVLGLGGELEPGEGAIGHWPEASAE